MDHGCNYSFKFIYQYMYHCILHNLLNFTDCLQIFQFDSKAFKKKIKIQIIIKWLK